MGILSSIMVLHGDSERVQSWLRLGQSVPSATFGQALEANLPWIVREPFNRIKSWLVHHNEWGIGNVVVDTLSDRGEALCLLNQPWTTHSMTSYQGFVNTFGFPKLPEGYRDLITGLWSMSEVDQIVLLVERLVSNFWELLTDED